MLNLTLKMAKANFFDRAKVKNAADAGVRNVLSRFGAFVRQRAKTSIRYRPETSLPRMPPNAHRTMSRRRRNKKTGAVRVQSVSPLRTYILFAWDGGTRSAVIGPTPTKPGSQVPRLLEYGGSATIKDSSTGKARKATYRARPFMRPAFDEELKLLPPLWRNSIR